MDKEVDMKTVILWVLGLVLLLAGGVALIELFSPGTLWSLLICLICGGIGGGFFASRIAEAIKKTFH